MESDNVPIMTVKKTLVRLPSTPEANQSSLSISMMAGPQSAPPVNSMRFFSPAGFAPSSPVTSPQSLSFQRPSAFSSTGQSHSLSFVKPQFTSIERMILKGSLAFNKSFSEEPQRIQEDVKLSAFSKMPDPLQIIQRVESIDETEEDEAEKEDKPRKKYVSAQDKIQMELQEQMKREKGNISRYPIDSAQIQDYF